MRMIDRSRREVADTCLRKRWLAYELNGRGVQGVGINMDLLYGLAVHKGLQLLYLGSPLPLVLEDSLKYFHGLCEKGGMVLRDGEQTPVLQVVEELSALLEAHLRAYAAVRLPVKLAEFKVLGVEQEFTAEIAPGYSLMVRVDLLLERYSDGAIFIHDFKTCSTPDGWWRKQFRYDVLTMSQVLPVEEALGKKLGGVVIEGICKGQRVEYPRRSGNRQQASPLIYGWRKPGIANAHPFEVADLWASKYEYQCVEAHKMLNGRHCEGNKSHTRSGYYKAPVWKEFSGGVEAWVKWLLVNDRELVEEQFVELPPILRSDWEVNEWVTSAIEAERRIEENAYICNGLIQQGVEVNQAELPSYFPKNSTRGNCVGCGFAGVCWGNEDPADETLFKPREFNHPIEGELVVEEVGR